MASNPAAATHEAPVARRPNLPRRFPLAANRRRLSYERRIRLWLAAFALPPVVLATLLAHSISHAMLLSLGVGASVSVMWLLAATYFFDQLIRPLQTLTNVVAALREDDFSFRARGARRGDTLGDLALEINALANTLQTQRSAARDALTLVERVMTSMPSPVLAFTLDGHLRLLNHAAEQAFDLTRGSAIGRAGADLGLSSMLQVEDADLYSHTVASSSSTPVATRWSIRRAAFRLHGVPHTLFVLSDVASALREEERRAWQRLIRVLSHEINNSLTPIKSIAGTLRSRLPELSSTDGESESDFHRGLVVIEERAASLNRFLQAYQQLTCLPAPQLQRFSLEDLLGKLASLETRVPVIVSQSLSLQVQADRDQLEQLLINLIRNAADAATYSDTATGHTPQVILQSFSTSDEIIVQILDNGLGLTNPANLFVPFYTTKPNGSGIGLVLARQIAAAHRGSLTLINRADTQGCMAELRLPAAIPSFLSMGPTTPR